MDAGRHAGVLGRFGNCSRPASDPLRAVEVGCEPRNVRRRRCGFSRETQLLVECLVGVRDLRFPHRRDRHDVVEKLRPAVTSAGPVDADYGDRPE